MSDVPAAPPLIELPVHPGPPPLRVHHLLAWMATTVALITGCMWFDRTARNGPPIESPVVIGSLMLAAIAIAGAFTCVGWGIHWRKCGYVFPKDPGDWLLTLVVYGAVGFCAIVTGVFAVFYVEEDWIPAYYVLAVAVLLVGWARFCARGMARLADTDAWRVVFGVMIVTPGVMLLATTFVSIRSGGVAVSALPVAIVMACLLWAVWTDRRYRMPRKWTHWFGVAVAMSLGMAIMAGYGF